MKMIEIIPRHRARLYGTLVAKEASIRKGGRGTYVRVGRKTASASRWTHKMYGGSSWGLLIGIPKIRLLRLQFTIAKSPNVSMR
jgi:hypothetical protein